MLIQLWRWLRDRSRSLSRWARPSHGRLRRRFGRPRLEALEERAVPATITPPDIITGPEAGLAPRVVVFNAATGAIECDFLAFDANLTTGLRVALGDVNGDGTPDVITALGQGSPPGIRIYDGRNNALIANFNAYNPRCLAGVFVAAGNFDNDPQLEVITGNGMKPRVRVFNITGNTGIQIPGALGSFLAYGSGFRGGVRVAAGNVDGQGLDELITSPGQGIAPRVRVFNTNRTRLSNFLAYDTRFRGGVFVASGDVDGNGVDEVITGPGQGLAPSVRIFNGAVGTQLTNFLAFNDTFQGGVRVGTVDADADGRADIIAGRGPGATPQVSTFDGQSLAQLDSFFAFDQSFQGGVFVAGT